MAAVLDVNLLCSKILEFKIVCDIANNYGIVLDSISCIDSWAWDNEQEIENAGILFDKIVADENKIIIAKFLSPEFKEIGLYIEKVGEKYLYTGWANTDGFPQLDCDVINKNNRAFYENIYGAILNLGELEPDAIEVVGIGIELDFYFSENIVQTIKKSKNIFVWILNCDIKEGELEKFRKREIKVEGKVIYEKIEC